MCDKREFAKPTSHRQPSPTNSSLRSNLNPPAVRAPAAKPSLYDKLRRHSPTRPSRPYPWLNAYDCTPRTTFDRRDRRKKTKLIKRPNIHYCPWVHSSLDRFAYEEVSDDDEPGCSGTEQNRRGRTSREDEKMLEDLLTRAQEKVKEMRVQRYGADHLYPDLFK
ncbi:hypothetical protein Aduo_018678 [Ancylostoma duodenale]